jgi:hypothetical protein
LLDDDSLRAESSGPDVTHRCRGFALPTQPEVLESFVAETLQFAEGSDGASYAGCNLEQKYAKQRNCKQPKREAQNPPFNQSHH